MKCLKLRMETVSYSTMKVKNLDPVEKDLSRNEKAEPAGLSVGPAQLQCGP